MDWHFNPYSLVFKELKMFASHEAADAAFAATESALKGTKRWWIQTILAWYLTGVAVFAVLAGLQQLFPSLPNLVVIAFVVPSLFMPFYLHFFWRKPIQRSLRLALRKEGVNICIECGYDLRGLDSLRCPECGWIAL